MLAGIVAIVLAVMVLASGVATFLKVPQVAANITAVGWPEDKLWVLATLKVLGGVGLLLGMVESAVGIAAAVGLVLYFVGALVAHLRVKNYDVAPAVLFLVLSVAAVVLLPNA